MRFRSQVTEAKQIRRGYDAMMTRTHTLEDNSPLRTSLGMLLDTEREIVEANQAPSGNITLGADELQLYLEVLEELATVHDDLNEAVGALRYYERLLQNDKCKLSRQTNATLEYEYCSGRFFSRSIILYRSLRRRDLARKAFARATAKTWMGERVHFWPNEYQIPTLYMQGLRGKPFWQDAPIGTFLEEHFDIIRKDFMAVIQSEEYAGVFTQNDHVLITNGSWGELKLFDGKEWKAPCRKLARRTCELLRSRDELVGTFPTARTHNVRLPKETGYFKLTPGTTLKPHTGPVNFHLYCHLGLVVPPGPALRVGRGKPRRWKEGKALCFDDSFEHEAWHDGEDARYVLMVTYWHPDLGQPTRDDSIPALPAEA